eukprot:15290407-Alexandrium_andersonii.AAC.1
MAGLRAVSMYLGAPSAPAPTLSDRMQARLALTQRLGRFEAASARIGGARSHGRWFALYKHMRQTASCYNSNSAD